jgi:hypothetical protein
MAENFCAEEAGRTAREEEAPRVYKKESGAALKIPEDGWTG